MPGRELTTAPARLERLLYLLPAAARSQEGIALAELAATLGVTPDLVLEDLREATARSYYQPPGAVEDFTIFLDGERVEVFAPHEFRRPVRLSARESLALELGLRTIAPECEPARRPQLLQLAERLGRALAAPVTPTVRDQRSATAPPQPELEAADALELAVGDDGFRGVVVDALEQGRACTLLYLKPGDPCPVARRVAPYRLVFADGLWYLVAHDLERGDCRIFRLDRTLDVRLEAEASLNVPPIDVAALLRHGVPYHAQDDFEVVVRYSARIAPWILEELEAERLADGSARVRHRVADPRWIVRHVLQYGGEAVVESPAEARGWVRAAALRSAG